MIDGEILGVVNVATSLALSSDYKIKFTIYFTGKEL
jgi:hypothetical protein